MEVKARDQPSHYCGLVVKVRPIPRQLSACVCVSKILLETKAVHSVPVRLLEDCKLKTFTAIAQGTQQQVLERWIHALTQEIKTLNEVLMILREISSANMEPTILPTIRLLHRSCR